MVAFAPCRGLVLSLGSGPLRRVHPRLRRLQEKALVVWRCVANSHPRLHLHPPLTHSMAAISCTLRPCVIAASAAPRATANKALKVRVWMRIELPQI